MKEHVNRNYKDTVFRLLFKDKGDLLELYNAINNTNYSNADDIVITSLEDALYIGLKNDISFIIANRINLYEHQSTLCRNMPLRGLFYISDLYKKSLKEPELLYRDKLYKIPTPQYIVFYNGNKCVEDITQMKLSDSFMVPTNNPAIEVKTRIVNINLGHNSKILDNCYKLKGYATLVSYIKENQKIMELEVAIREAIERCISENVLKEFLESHKAEVSRVFLAQYNEERMRELIKEDSFEEGMEKGIVCGREQGISEGLEEGRNEGKIESILELLTELGEIPDMLEEQLHKENDALRLKEMLKYASKADSIEAFMKNFGIEML